MNNDSLQAFLARLENDPSLRDELRAAGFDAGMSADAVMAFAAGKGVALGIEEVDQLGDAQLDAVAGGGDSESMRMQAIMERRAKVMETLSNLMQKMSAVGDSIIQNIK